MPVLQSTRVDSIKCVPSIRVTDEEVRWGGTGQCSCNRITLTSSALHCTLLHVIIQYHCNIWSIFRAISTIRVMKRSAGLGPAVQWNCNRITLTSYAPPPAACNQISLHGLHLQILRSVDVGASLSAGAN